MPELPEVHTTATDLNKLLKGKKIVDVWTSYDSPFYKGKAQIKNPRYFKIFKKEIIGEKITSVSRRAKNVLIHSSGNKTILVHMKMTGHLLFGKYKKVGKEWQPVESGPLQDKWNGWVRLVFTLENTDRKTSSHKTEHLALSDLRKFAKVTLLQTDRLEQSEDLEGLGPDPLSAKFNLKRFSEQINRRPNAKIKTALMDQKLIAGIGNIYSDEALWLSRIHPETIVRKLSEEKLKVLLKNIKMILKKGISLKGDSMSDYRRPSGKPGAFQHQHKVYQRKKEKCLRKGCEGEIVRKVVGSRSAHFCNKCQK